MSFNYNHPTIVVEFPAPGHYVIRGLPHQTVFVEGKGHVTANDVCYISPAVPDDLLEAVLRDREDRRERGEETAEEKGAVKAKRGRGRPSKGRANKRGKTTSTSPINPATGAHDIEGSKPAAAESKPTP